MFCAFIDDIFKIVVKVYTEYQIEHDFQTPSSIPSSNPYDIKGKDEGIFYLFLKRIFIDFDVINTKFFELFKNFL